MNDSMSAGAAEDANAAGLTEVQWLPGWRTGRDRIIATKPPQAT